MAYAALLLSSFGVIDMRAISGWMLADGACVVSVRQAASRQRADVGVQMLVWSFALHLRDAATDREVGRQELRARLVEHIGLGLVLFAHRRLKIGLVLTVAPAHLPHVSRSRQKAHEQQQTCVMLLHAPSR